MSRIVRKDTDSDGVEVNIMYVFGLLLRRLWLLILVALVVGASCAVITKAVEEPTYTLNMTFIVNNKSEKDLSSSGENSVSYNDMSASAYMANTFVHLMTGRTMCNAIAAECKSYPKTADQVAKMIAASRKTDSSIIDMTVTASSPEEAYELAQAVKDTYKDVVQVYSGGSIHLCDEPELPTKPDKSVGTVRNTIIGALAGAVICALIIIIRDSARNTVRSQEDIQNKLQLNVIGEVSQVPGGERFYKKSAHGGRELLITDKPAALRSLRHTRRCEQSWNCSMADADTRALSFRAPELTRARQRLPLTFRLRSHRTDIPCCLLMPISESRQCSRISA